MKRLMTLAAFLLLFGVGACEPDVPEAEASPPPPPASINFGLTVQAPDTVSFIATWPPVVFQGDTIRRYRRTLTRTDTAQDLTIFGLDDNAAVNSVGSEDFSIPGPGEGETGEYRYCLRSVDADGTVGRDSTCTLFQYTAPVVFPPPPDSITVSEQVAIAYDSATVFPDSVVFRYHVTEAGDTVWDYALGFDKGSRVDSIPGGDYRLSVRVWQGDEIVGCAGRCGTTPISAASFVQGIPFYLKGREGYPLGQEWTTERLPWLRILTG